MDAQHQQAAERIKEANNILVTVSANPSVDQLAACIGLTLALNKMGKHATAVFSGAVPSTIEFLQPEKTIEKNTDSLRDFIIALDKAKADKLRYKVEDTVVKIFITPYRTSISDKDLEFSQGDFNVDVVLALGVHNQADLDQAITSHGRILHDATVVTLNIKPGGELGSINWLDPTASSLSELAVQLTDMLDKNVMDSQIATAMLTGVVAETDRFSNNKTTPRTMTISAELMSAGANQQLVATKLAEPAPVPAAPVIAGALAHESPEPAGAATAEVPKPAKKPEDGTLEITHDNKKTPASDASHKPDVSSDESDHHEEPAPDDEPESPDLPTVPEHSDDAPEPDEAVAKPIESAPAAATFPAPESAPAPVVDESAPALEVPEAKAPQIHIDEHGSLSPIDQLPPPVMDHPAISHHHEGPKMVLEPPTMGGPLTANITPESYDPAVDPLTSAPLGGSGAPLPVAEHVQETADKPAVAPTIVPPVDLTPPAPANDAFGMPSYEALDSEPPAIAGAPMNDAAAPGVPETTLSDLEREVNSPHLAGGLDLPPADLPAPSFTPPAMPATPSFQTPAGITPPVGPLSPEPVVPFADLSKPLGEPDVQGARDAVQDAILQTAPQSLPPVEALNAQPVVLPGLGQPEAPVASEVPGSEFSIPGQPVVSPSFAPAPLTPPASGSLPASGGNAVVTDPNSPPPVPPPFMPGMPGTPQPPQPGSGSPYTQPY